jgi:hypothetical protein
MAAVTAKRQTNSRWDRKPILRDGIKAIASLTPRDIEVLKVLARYRYLPADYIHALVGGSMKALVHRLALLTREPNLYIARPIQQRAHFNARYQRLIYELDTRGVTVLRELGFDVDKTRVHNFAHELMVGQITASIELGVRADPNVRLITWAEIIESEKTPLATRQSLRSTHIPVTYTVHKEQHRTEICADGKPFGLERTIDGKRSYLFFPGIEADCGTEPVSTSDFERSSIYKKFAAYTAITDNGIHRAHFGFPNLFVPIITTTKVRMESMMRLLDRLTHGQGSKIFLFKTFPAFTSFEPPREATGHMLTEAWLRVGHEPFHLDI